MDALLRVARDARRVIGEGGDRFVQVEARLPALDLAALSDALPHEPMIFWAPPGGPITLGLGATLTLRGHGDARFAELRDAAASLPAWAELFCGFAFSPGTPDSSGGFGDAIALLPRFVLRSSGSTTTLHVTIDREAHFDLEAQLTQLTQAMSRPAPALPPPRSVQESAVEADRFVSLVTQARDAIERGAFDKVVLHRQTSVPRDTGSARSAAQTLITLLATQPDSTAYAFRVDGTTFLGATPERLVRRQGKTLRSDVLAGSWPRDGAERLLDSAKDRSEHELTRRAIADILRPLCTRYDEHGPRVRALPNIYHLHTEIEGTLASSRHVLDLVAALHPTPAVGGLPRKEALAFLAQHEQLERGWYAAPIGWFRPDGDGDFAVALRCALIEPHTVTLYAGAGIVAASDPARELAETTTKRRAIANALGVEIK